MPWVKLKPLIILKLEKVIEHVTNEEEDLSFLDEKIQVSASDGSPLSGGDGDPSSIHILKMKKRIVSALNNFQGIPFTIQVDNIPGRDLDLDLDDTQTVTKP